jgi:hypothetical protein
MKQVGFDVADPGACTRAALIASISADPSMAVS